MYSSPDHLHCLSVHVNCSVKGAARREVLVQRVLNGTYNFSQSINWIIFSQALYVICQLLLQWVKKVFNSLSVINIATEMIPLCEVYTWTLHHKLPSIHHTRMVFAKVCPL